MLNSLSEKLVSYVSSSPDVGREDTENIVEDVQSSVESSNNGGKHKRCESPIDVETYEPCVKKRRTDESFVQKVTNSVARMAEWLVHGTNYLLGRMDGTQLNLKEIEDDGAKNGHCRIPNRSERITSTIQTQHQEHEYHRPPIHDETGLFDNQRKTKTNGNASALHILYNAKSQNVSLSQPPLYNGIGAKYTINPGVRVNCSNMKNVDLSSNKLYSVPRRQKVRNDVCNVVQKHHMHTAVQFVRLEEKERYRRLLQQFSRGDYNDRSAVKSEEKDTSSVTSKNSNHLERCSPLEDLLSDQLQDAKNKELEEAPPVLTETVVNKETTPDQTFISETPPTPKQKINFSYLESPEESQSSEPEKSSSEPEKSSESKSSTSSPRPSVRLKNNPYLAEDWVTKLVKKYSASTREQQRKIEEQHRKLIIFEEQRKSQEDQLNDEIQRRLRLSEKEPPVLEVDKTTVTIGPESESESEEPPPLPVITDAMKREIDGALKPRPSEEVLVEGFRIQIKRTDMTTLSGLTWLNDEVINFYMNLLMERSHQGSRPKVHSFNTFFYPKLQSTGYDGVRRWTRKVDIFSVKYLLIPVHLGMHWCLAIVNLPDKIITYYDSMGGKNQQCLDTIKKYLFDESMDKRKTPIDLDEWTTKIARNVPHQMNGSDCGMFACKYADYITREIPISFTQADMPKFRRLMVYEILKKKLLT